jgi:alkylhydroperoxidase family enzyme
MPRVHVPESSAQDPSAHVWTAYCPEIGAAAGAYSLAVYQHSKLSLRELEAARVVTARINGCKLCDTMRAGRDLQAHIERSGGNPAISVVARGGPAPDEAFYVALEDWRTSPLFSPRERLAIDFAERFGAAPKSIPGDETFWAELHANFSDADIVDLTFAVGSWVAFGRLTHILELDNACMITFPDEVKQARSSAAA